MSISLTISSLPGTYSLMKRSAFVIHKWIIPEYLSNNF